jgi:hypothetical protein
MTTAPITIIEPEVTLLVLIRHIPFNVPSKVGFTVDSKLMKSYSFGSFKMYIPPPLKNEVDVDILSQQVVKRLEKHLTCFGGGNMVQCGRFTVSAIPKNDRIRKDDKKHVSKAGNEMNEMKKKHEQPKGVKVEKILEGRMEVRKGLWEMVEQGQWTDGMGLDVLLFGDKEVTGYCQDHDMFFEIQKDGNGHNCSFGGHI